MKVLAGPGSGKTRVLVGRVTHLINELGVPPSQVRSIHWSPYDRVGVVNADP
jgi:DNA helicase-2/ATP-dependent DNA helicase PcrA